jgi:predicted AAA+ superfamily ATPase
MPVPSKKEIMEFSPINMGGKEIDEGIVITKDLFDERMVKGKKIIYIPLDVFLLANLSSL